MQIAKFKRGDSWSYTATVDFKDVNGNPITIQNVTIISELKIPNSSKVVQRFYTEWLNPSSGTFIHKASSGETSIWPIGQLVFDITFRLNNTGDVITSSPVYVQVV
jgi:hypothetical protein